MRLSSASTSRTRLARVASSERAACWAAVSASLVERCSSSARVAKKSRMVRWTRRSVSRESLPTTNPTSSVYLRWAWRAWLRRMASWRSFSPRSAWRPMNSPMMIVAGLAMASPAMRPSMPNMSRPP